MASIQRLPQYLINRLKAGEIVERPASVLKELIENSLDAGATSITVSIEKGGKQSIQIQDNGSGMGKDDIQLALERYATSKISSYEDLEKISSYGFRGEALASISEVSYFTLQSKSKDSLIAYQITQDDDYSSLREIPFPQESGTIITVKDLFRAIPAREKYLKTDATERNYIRQLFFQYALAHPQKERICQKDGKTLYRFSPAGSLLERILDVTKPEREQNLKEVAFEDDQCSLYGVVGDATLHFPHSQYVWLFVNGRPVQDRLLKRSLYDAYQRQIVPGTHPFACLFLEVDPRCVDVNVHPRKSEVKFIDPGSMFTLVKETVRGVLGDKRVQYSSFNQQTVRSGHGSGQYFPPNKAGLTPDQFSNLQEVKKQQNKGNSRGSLFSGIDLGGVFLSSSEDSSVGELMLENEPMKLIGQVWNMYILLESPTGLIVVDQHALAERITFEKMKLDIKKTGFESEILLSPLIVSPPSHVQLSDVSELVESIGFDISDFGNGKLIIHSIPKIFSRYKIDIEILMNRIRSTGAIFSLDGKRSLPDDPYSLFSLMIDEIVGMKACKASIKAGQKLHQQEMYSLVKDGIDHIPGMFVCQHGRPSVVKVEKHTIDQLFDR